MLSEFTSLTSDEVKTIISLPGHSQQAIHGQIVAEARKQSISLQVNGDKFYAVEVDEGTIGREKYFDINVLFEDLPTGGLVNFWDFQRSQPPVGHMSGKQLQTQFHFLSGRRQCCYT